MRGAHWIGLLYEPSEGCRCLFGKERLFQAVNLVDKPVCSALIVTESLSDHDVWSWFDRTGQHRGAVDGHRRASALQVSDIREAGAQSDLVMRNEEWIPETAKVGEPVGCNVEQCGVELLLRLDFLYFRYDA